MSSTHSLQIDDLGPVDLHGLVVVGPWQGLAWGCLTNRDPGFGSGRDPCWISHEIFREALPSVSADHLELSVLQNTTSLFSAYHLLSLSIDLPNPSNPLIRLLQNGECYSVALELGPSISRGNCASLSPSRTGSIRRARAACCKRTPPRAPQI